MAYEWDEAKNFSNFLKHRVRFEDALYVFEDSYRIILADEGTSTEERFICIGMNFIIGVLVVVYCERRDSIRIISARKASPNERTAYEKRI